MNQINLVLLLFFPLCVNAADSGKENLTPNLQHSCIKFNNPPKGNIVSSSLPLIVTMPPKEDSSPVTPSLKMEEITLKGELTEKELDRLKQPYKKITLVSVFGRVGGSFNRHRRLLVSGDTLFKGVEILSMPSCDLGDESITRMGELSMIRELNLSGSQITDEGIRILSKLPHLEKLNISMNRITDEGMAIITRLNLTDLDVSLNEKVSDVGVNPFLHSTKLTTLIIECNNITREKAQELKAHINKVVYFPGKKVRPPEIMMEW